MNPMRILLFCSLIMVAVPASLLVTAHERSVNVPLPTFGGKQIWADAFYDAGWRIQENVLTGHHRLLDQRNVRRAWGTYEHCHAVFKQQGGLGQPEHRGRHLVLLVHGLGRSAGMFADLTDVLRADGFEVAAVNYASTRQSVDDHAGHLAHLIANLDGVERVSFVTHSMGGLVVRALLARSGLAASGIRFENLVMIAPPNQGSAIADALKDFPAYRWLATEAGQDLTSGAAPALPVPTIDFGIIAGGRGDGTGFNPLLDGDNDGVVTVDETRLEGARDFLIVPSPHGLVDNHPETIKAIRGFLDCGRFSCAPSKAP